MCHSLKLRLNGLPRCPDVPNATRCDGIAGSGFRSEYAASNFGIDDERRLMANVNLGMTRVEQGAWHRLAGVGFEFAVTKEVALLAERLWAARLSQATQAGVRYYFGKDDGNSVDLVVGRERERALPASRWATIGLNLAF